MRVLLQKNLPLSQNCAVGGCLLKPNRASVRLLQASKDLIKILMNISMRLINREWRMGDVKKAIRKIVLFVQL